MRKENYHFGQSLIEFALILPIALFLLFGFFDLGRVIFYYSSLSNAVREASRSGVVLKYTGHEEDYQDYLEKKVMEYGFGLDTGDNPLGSDVEGEEKDIVVDIKPVAITNDYFTQEIVIVAKYCFQPVTPGIILLFGTVCDNGSTGIELTAESVMRMEPGTLVE